MFKGLLLSGTGIKTGTSGTGTNEISELNNDSKFKVFPNPATSEMNVSFGTALDRTVTLFSLTGEVIEVKTTSGLSTNFDVIDLPQGVYLIEVSTSNSTYTERVIVK